MTPSPRRIAPWMAAALLLWGCGSYPLPRIYNLGDNTPAVSGLTTSTSQPIIELKTVQVPDDLDTSDIIRRVGANQVIASARGRWGARLSVGVTEDLVATLSRALPEAIIENRGAYEPTRRLLVTLSRFEISPAGRCVVSARWRLTNAAGKVLSDSEQGTFVEIANSGSDAAAAAAMTVALDHLATRIATTVRSVVLQPPPAA